jgi:RNA polymerase sigma-70 factor (ECF subfamily)
MTVHPSDDFGTKLIGFLPNLRRFAISLCRSRDVADDLVQLACERALAHQASFQPGTRFDSWMFRILRNLWIDQLRRTRTSGQQLEVGALEARLPGDPGTTPENRLMLADVLRSIQALPDDQREVLLLVCIEDFSYREAAETLEIPIGTVMSRLARARMAIAADAGISGAVKRSLPYDGSSDHG